LRLYLYRRATRFERRRLHTQVATGHPDARLRCNQANVALYEGEAQHVVSAHTGTDFDYADNPAAAAMSSGENQLIYRIDVVHHI
jgi:hypothetical protein